MSVLISDDLTVAVGGVVQMLTGISSASAVKVAGAAPTTPVEKQQGSAEIAIWGEGNLFPTEVRRDAEESTILATALEWKARAWYGSGLVYGLVTLDETTGEEVFKRVKLPEVDAFLKRSRRYAYESLLSISYFANAFPELLLTKDRSKIHSICDQDPEFCRYSRPNGQGLVSHVFINANWANGGKVEDSAKVPVIDPYFEGAEEVRQRKDGFKYIYPISIPSPGKTLYQLASWNTIRRTEWLQLLKKIPTFKVKTLDNQLTIKYVVEVHGKYWEWKYGDWDIKTKEERQRIIAEEVDSFNKTMSGVEGAGKSVFALTIQNPLNPEEHVSAFKVTPIDDKIKSGVYIEDSQEAASHAYTAVGVAPTLLGVSPGKGMGAGSGSDARVAFNNFISTSRFVQDLVLEPLHFVRDYNGWPENLQFRFQVPLIMTLDEGKSSDQETK